ncbi:hypothetical protein ABTY96_28555 [Streptomyces sp. NPDC096057]
MTNQTETARLVRAVPGRRLIAAGIISPKIDVRITEAGLVGILRKGVRR